MTTLALHNSQLFYQTSGSPQDPALVLVNGHGRTSKDFKVFGRKLTDAGFFVITFDNRGCGKTTHRQNIFTLNDIATDLFQLCTHLNLHKIHLVGFSMGGMIAQCFAAQHPEKLESLTLVSSSRRKMSPQSPAHIPWSSEYKHNLDKICQYVANSFYRHNPLILESIAKENQKNTSCAPDPQSLAIQTFLNSPPPAQSHPHFSVHIIHGSEDKVFSVADAKHLQQQYGPDCDLELLDNTGHLILIEKNPLLLMLLRKRLHKQHSS
ncbi:MAG: alpha/beta hydrolase [Zetaproteobacteria bacterium]|nr:alpha/beta hydrolase [Zetaproteobacteria bacterium]